MGNGIITISQQKVVPGYLNEPILSVVLITDKVLCLPVQGLAESVTREFLRTGALTGLS